MKRSCSLFRYCFFLLCVVLLAGCGGASVVKPSEPIKKVALASLVVSNWKGSMGTAVGGYNNYIERLINKNLEDMVSFTESTLSEMMKVAKVATFVSNPKYRDLGLKEYRDDIEHITTPTISNQAMEVLARNNKDLVGGLIRPEIAKKLCADLDVDAIVLVYSEWTTQEGHFVRLRKALTKNVITFWDRNGHLIFKQRNDVMGEKLIGVAAMKVVAESTIHEWVDSYKRALLQLHVDMKKLTI